MACLLRKRASLSLLSLTNTSLKPFSSSLLINNDAAPEITQIPFEDNQVPQITKIPPFQTEITNMPLNLTSSQIGGGNEESDITKMPPDLNEDDDDEGAEITKMPSALTPEETQMAHKLHTLIKDHFRKNPNLQNPNSLNPNFTIPSLTAAFSSVDPTELTQAVVSTVVARCRGVRHGIPLPQVLTFFNWARGKMVISSEGYTQMIDLAGKVRDFNLAWGLVDSMRSDNAVVEVPVEVFMSLIRRYVRAGMVVEGIYVFERMEEYGCVPNQAVFECMIAILCRKKRVVEAQTFFDRWKARFDVDVVVYTCLVNGWCRVGNLGEAERVFKEMKLAGIEPNVYTYSTVIDALCRFGQINRAHDVLAEMIDNGCQPNAVTFNNLMRVHVKGERTEKVLQVYNQMKRLGCVPDSITFNYLIEAHCRDGNRDEAIKVVHQMVNKGCVPNAHSFNPIFSCIAKDKDVNGAHKLFAKMKELKCEGNTVTYNTLMRMFVQSKSTDMVLKLKKEMDELGIEPNVNTYKILISMYCAMGHWSNAYKYFREMIEEKSLKPSLPLYQMVLQQLRKAEQIKKHEELVEKMVERGFVTRPI